MSSFQSLTKNSILWERSRREVCIESRPVLPLLKKCHFQTAYHQFYVAAECCIKYSRIFLLYFYIVYIEIYFVCKEAHEISHVGWGRFDWHMNRKANQRKFLKLKVVTCAFLFNPTHTDLYWHLRYLHYSCLRQCKLYVHIFGWFQDPVHVRSISSKKESFEILHGLSGVSGEAMGILNFGSWKTEILLCLF